MKNEYGVWRGDCNRIVTPDPIAHPTASPPTIALDPFDANELRELVEAEIERAHERTKRLAAELDQAKFDLSRLNGLRSRLARRLLAEGIDIS